MGEWLRYLVCVAALPVVAVDDWLHHRKYRRWLAAHEQARRAFYEGE